MSQENNLEQKFKNFRVITYSKPLIVVEISITTSFWFHSYINYAKTVWVSTSQTRLKKVLAKQKHSVPVTFNVNKETRTRPLFKELIALNIYKVNLLQVLIFKKSVKISTYLRVSLTYHQRNFNLADAFSQYTKFSRFLQNLSRPKVTE